MKENLQIIGMELKTALDHQKGPRKFRLILLRKMEIIRELKCVKKLVSLPDLF
jgi:hypothetical protein